MSPTIFKKKFFLLLISILIGFQKNYAQQNLPLNREWGLDFEKENNKISKKDSLHKSSDSLSASCFKPYIISIQRTEKNKSKPYLKRKLSNENLVIVNDTADNFYLTLDPLFNFEAGKDFADNSGEKLYKNTRGILVKGAIGNKFYFESSFYENQATFPQYIDNYIASTKNIFPGISGINRGIVPGQGIAKVYRTNGYDYAMSSGYISYSPNKIFNFQLGHGKNFIGDGYRSLLLSDNAYNYPYARITTTYKNIQYTNLYTVFMNLTNGGVRTPAYIEPLFQKKVGNFQFLSFNLWNRLQLGLFQGMSWQPADTTNKQHLNFNIFDPIIGVNSAVYGLRSKNNILLGSTFKFKFTNSISFYGQYVLDDIHRKSDNNDIHKKYGYQLGIKYFNVFKIKNLHFQLEYNSVRPYTYSADNPQYSYTHYDQALADPLGANFKEAIVFLNYRKNRFFIQLKFNYAVKGVDSSAVNFGGNIFNTDNTFSPLQNLNSIITTQGLKTTITYQDFQMGYLVNPATNFNIMFGVTNRYAITTVNTQRTEYVYFGIRTSLANFYYDF